MIDVKIVFNLPILSEDVNQSSFTGYEGFHSHGGTHIAGWFIVENPKQKIR